MTKTPSKEFQNKASTSTVQSVPRAKKRIELPAVESDSESDEEEGLLPTLLDSHTDECTMDDYQQETVNEDDDNGTER